VPTKILSTKLYIPPPRKNVVSRPRLLDHLRQGSTSKLALISAPAGYGKTTLLSEWIDQQEMPFGWLSLDQGDITRSGHSIEARVYAEDSEADFAPSPGTIHYYLEPDGKGIRVDSGIDGKAEIHPDYDPMVCKVISHGNDRRQAIDRLHEALGRFHIHGTRNNISFLRAVLADEAFVANRISTSYCRLEIDRLKESMSREKSRIDDRIITASL